MAATGNGSNNGPGGVINNPDLASIWPSKNGWRVASSAAWRGRGVLWAHSGAVSTLTNGYNPPNRTIPDVVIHFTGFFGPRSWHTGGAQTLMGGGAVRFFSDNIDLNFHRGLHSVNGGEVLDEFQRVGQLRFRFEIPDLKIEF